MQHIKLFYSKNVNTRNMKVKHVKVYAGCVKVRENIFWIYARETGT